jgi:hypothetical protein
VGYIVDDVYGLLSQSGEWRYREEFPQEVSAEYKKNYAMSILGMNEKICASTSLRIGSQNSCRLFFSNLLQWSQGNVRLQPQFMDGHPLLGSCHRMAQLQIRGKERIGEGSYSRESD